VLLLALVAAGCSEAAVPVPGTLTLQLAGTRGGEGAVVVTVSGAPLGAVHASGDYQVVAHQDGGGTHVLVVGALTRGGIATIDIPDTALSGRYVVTVDQVANGGTFALLDASPYRVTLAVTP
jgi:hypothetical protein